MKTLSTLQDTMTALPDRFRYRLELEPAGTYRFVFPELPEADFSAKTIKDGHSAMLDAVLEALEKRLKSKNIPMQAHARAGEGVFQLTPTYTAKLLLILTARERGVRAADIARSLGVAPQEAARILKLSHPTKMDTINAAFESMGFRIVLGLAKI